MKVAILLFLAALQLTAVVAYKSCVAVNPNPVTRVKSPLPYADIALKAPAAYDWRNVNGRNFVTVSRNQHLPQYCGSCWAFATTSALGDRIRIQTQGAFPEAELAPQVLLNCLQGSTCDGGDPNAAYEYMAEKGIPDETCAPYEAVDNECTPENICKNCQPDFSDPTADCSAVSNYTNHVVDEHGTLNGTDAMIAEIYARGPIVCVIAVTDALESYTGGIFNDTTGAKGLDHAISVVGWGQDGNQAYWIVRNSWGTFWGERGWFRIVRGVDNLGIESQGCYWATPKN